MASTVNLESLFVDNLKDMYYAEKKIVKALPKMARAVGDESRTADAFTRHAEETEDQIERLERVFEILGQKPKTKTCEAMDGMIREAEDLMKKAEGPGLEAGLVAAAQTVEHFEIARYGTLIEWADLMGYDEAAELLEETLNEEKRTDQMLSDMAVRGGINQRAYEAQEQMSEEDEEEQQPSRKQSSNRQRRRAA